MAKKLKPVSIAGIEFDALISVDQSYQQDIPDYPVEDGYSVSDTIILKPIVVNLALYVSNTPVTWRIRHGISTNRVNLVCKNLENLYFSKKLVKVITPDAIYTNMGITSMQIMKNKELSNTRQVTISLKKVYVTKKKTAKIPVHILKSGETKKNAGKASTSSKSKKSSVSSSASGNSQRNASPSSTTSTSDSKKKRSILYGAASNYGFV